MSRYSNKSDFCDWCCMHNTPKDIVEKATVYMGHAKIAVNEERDLIPYYTNLISMMTASSESQTIYLTQDSHIDTEEAEFLSTKVYHAIKWKRKADKEKAVFDYSFICNQRELWHGSDEKPVWNKIISTINANPEIAKFHLNKDYGKARYFIESYLIPNYFRGIHDKMHNYYREQFIEYCSENGYCTFSWNAKTSKVDYKDEGEWHPIVRDMCFAIADYYKMMEEFNND